MSNNPHFLQGQQKYAEKDFSAAVDLFTKAIEKEENPYIYYERALSYLHLRQAQASLTDLNTACSLQPENPFRYSSRAYVKEIVGDLTGAKADYEKCLELDPNDAVALNNLGLLEEKMGRKEQAKKLVKRADKLAEADAYLKKQKTQAANSQHPLPTEEQPTPGLKAYWDMFKETFSNKERFNEFLTFVKKGLK